MIRVQHNGRTLGIRFCYSKTYALDIPMTKEEYAANGNKGTHWKRVTRPLTQCYIEEGTGRDRRIIAKCEKRLYHRDQPFPRNSPEMEQFRKLLIKYAMKAAGDQLSKDERHILWHAFLTRHTVKPNVLPPKGGGTPAPSMSKGMMTTRTQVIEPTPPDTIPDGRRIVPVVATPKSPDGHGVSNVLLFPAGRWNYDLFERVLPGETRH